MNPRDATLPLMQPCGNENASAGGEAMPSRSHRGPPPEEADLLNAHDMGKALPKRISPQHALGRAWQAVTGHLISIAFAVCAAGLLSLGFFSFYLFERSQQTDELVLHTAVVIGKLERLHLTIVEAESAGRASLVFATLQVRSSYDTTLARIDDELREFKALTSDNPEQQQLIVALEQRIASRFAYLQALIGVRTARGIDVMLNTTVGTGTQEMEAIKADIAHMEGMETELLTRRKIMQAERDQQLQLTLALFMVAGMGVIAALFWNLHRLWNAREKAEARAVHEAHHDALTGLPNRRLLYDRMSITLALARRQNATMAVLSMDLDGFKKVNDTHGHDAGDELLRQVAARLKNLVRGQDTVARMGGDEFVLTLYPARDVDEVKAVMERIRDSVAAPYDVFGHEVTIGASVGLALYPADSANEEQLLKHADSSLYEAKRRLRLHAV